MTKEQILFLTELSELLKKYNANLFSGCCCCGDTEVFFKDGVKIDRLCERMESDNFELDKT